MGRVLAVTITLLIAAAGGPGSAVYAQEGSDSVFVPLPPLPGGPPDPAEPSPGDPAPADPAPAEPGPGPSEPAKPKAKKLSDERTFTTWAYYRRAAPVVTRPGGGRRVATLHRMTADNLLQVYLALRSVVRNGQEWVFIRVPVRPNGTKGWVRRDALGAFNRVTTQIVISRRAFRLTLYRGGRKQFSVPIGIGSRSNPTPRGRFWINQAFAVDNRPVYGPYAMGTSAFSPKLSDWPGGGVVGLHGTNQPKLIPGRPSHGCVRLRNADITKLIRRAPVGTPVLIR